MSLMKLNGGEKYCVLEEMIETERITNKMRDIVAELVGNFIFYLTVMNRTWTDKMYE